jgi:hypothetical protein
VPLTGAGRNPLDRDASAGRPASWWLEGGATDPRSLGSTQPRADRGIAASVGSVAETLAASQLTALGGELPAEVRLSSDSTAASGSSSYVCIASRLSQRLML